MFEGLKLKMQKKIEKNAVESNLSWTDKEGNEHTETVLLKKSSLPFVGDWARIYPPVNEDGSWNIVNLLFGGKRNLFKFMFIALIIFMVFLQFKEMFNYIGTINDNACWQSCIALAKEQTQNPLINPFN